MPSPFPGMDPYIESEGIWSGFHGSLVAEFKQRLNAQLPQPYVADLDSFVWIHEPAAKDRMPLGEPDGEEPTIHIKRRGPMIGSTGATESAAVAAATSTAVLPAVQLDRERYVQIIDVLRDRVVTAIEVLSPANKTGVGREASQVKRAELLAARTSVVEIDLLRGGGRLPMGEPTAPKSDFAILVGRSWEQPRVSIWSFGLRDRLPTIPVPLDPEVADVALNLQECVERVYEQSAYARRLRYAAPISPALSDDDAAWAAGLVRSR